MIYTKISKNIKIKIETFEEEYQNFLKMVEKISQVETENIEPMFRTINNEFLNLNNNIYENDYISKDEELENGFYFQTPKILKADE